jgi:hypothetical protein
MVRVWLGAKIMHHHDIELYKFISGSQIIFPSEVRWRKTNIQGSEAQRLSAFEINAFVPLIISAFLRFQDHSSVRGQSLRKNQTGETV